MTMLSSFDKSIFAGRYRVVRHIATGGMGDVYEVVHLKTDRNLALKVMRPHALTGDDTRERFRREACVTAKIRSEHLVEIVDAGVDEATDMPFLVMELLEGEDVGARIERAGRFSPSEVVTLLHQTSIALDKMHKAGVVHRDLKPENIFLTERDDGSPRVKLLDFGIAKILVDQADQVAITSELIGTPLYMAPEQLRAGITASSASDIYSLGMVAYTMIVGAPYWMREIERGASLPVLASSIMRGLVETPSARASGLGVALPRAFDAWFSQATASLPAHRFTTAQASVAALADALGVPRPARQESPPSSPRHIHPAPSSPGPPSAPNSQGAARSRIKRAVSGLINASFAATLATPNARPRDAKRHRRWLELTVGLAVSLTIGAGALLMRSRSSASTALAKETSTVFAKETSPVERRLAPPAVERGSEEWSLEPVPPENKAPELPAVDAMPSGSQKDPARSSMGSPRGAITSAGSPAMGITAANPKKPSTRGPPPMEKPPEKSIPPFVHDMLE